MERGEEMGLERVEEMTDEMAEESSSKVKLRGDGARAMVIANVMLL
jgi:hypothetical protein